MGNQSHLGTSLLVPASVLNNVFVCCLLSSRLPPHGPPSAFSLHPTNFFSDLFPHCPPPPPPPLRVWYVLPSHYPLSSISALPRVFFLIPSSFIPFPFLFILFFLKLNFFFFPFILFYHPNLLVSPSSSHLAYFLFSYPSISSLNFLFFPFPFLCILLPVWSSHLLSNLFSFPSPFLLLSSLLCHPLVSSLLPSFIISFTNLIPSILPALSTFLPSPLHLISPLFLFSHPAFIAKIFQAPEASVPTYPKNLGEQLLWRSPAEPGDPGSTHPALHWEMRRLHRAHRWVVCFRLLFPTRFLYFCSFHLSICLLAVCWGTTKLSLVFWNSCKVQPVLLLHAKALWLFAVKVPLMSFQMSNWMREGGGHEFKF